MDPSLTVSAIFPDRDPEFMRVHEIDFWWFSKFAGFVIFESRKPLPLLTQFDSRNCQTSVYTKHSLERSEGIDREKVIQEIIIALVTLERFWNSHFMPEDVYQSVI